MSTIFDIPTPYANVDVGGGLQIKVEGVGLDALIPLVSEHETLIHLLNGDGKKITHEQIVRLVSKTPELLAKVIAAGTGFPGNEEAEAKARRLPMTVQLRLLPAILKQTMPDGPEVFMKDLIDTLVSAGLIEVTPKEESEVAAS